MALKKGQQNALKTLQQRQKAGTIKEGGLARLEQLRAQQGGGGMAGVKTPALRRANINKPKSVIRAQTEANKQAADSTFQMQNPSSQTNPYGYQNVTRDAQGNVVVDSGFAPGQQQIFDYQQEMLRNLYGDGASGGGIFGSLPNTQDLAGERQRIEGDLYNSYTQGFDTEKANELEALNQSLAERGIPVGSGAAYSNVMKDFNQRWDDRFSQARQAATAGGGQEWERSFNIGSQGALLPLQQAAGLFGLGGPQMGQFAGYAGGQMGPTNIGDIFGTWRGQNFQRDIANQNNATQMGIANMNRPPAPNLGPPPTPPPGY